MIVCHTCDTPLCVNPEHLFIGTVHDNVKDRDNKNRQAKGRKIGLAKLTDAKARKIFTMKGTQQEIADKFGVAQAQVSKIKNRDTWKHATKDLNNA